MRLGLFCQVMFRAAVALAVLGAAVSAAPASAGAQSEIAGHFSDDDGSVHEPALNALAGRGVLAGMECGDGLICPDEPLKRREMAVWLVRVLDGTDPARAGASRFADVDAERWWAPFVDRLHELGVTAGCATEPARFCPRGRVTRAQMATFLKRALDLEPAGAAGFGDVGGGPHAANIDALARAGITGGCGRDPLRYCPGRSVTRAQMATFLARALDLVELPAVVRFTQIDAGHGHTCGLRADGTVACWGDNRRGESDAPSGRFSVVGAGREYSCGLRQDGTVACWGAGVDGPDPLPEGRFSMLSVGDSAACGLRHDGTVECWEAGWEIARYIPTTGSAIMDVPDGKFTSVSVGSSEACARRLDGAFTCWGLEGDLFVDASVGRFREIDVGALFACGLGVDGSVFCWDPRERVPRVPNGTFTSISVGFKHACGLRSDGTAVCWGETLKARAGEFEAISAGYRHTCGLRANRKVDCWGAVADARTRIPAGSFKSVHAGLAFSCGLRNDSAAVCWGSNFSGQTEAPAGLFRALAAGTFHSCGVRTDATVACWGTNEDGQADEPDGVFEAVAAGDLHSCGLRTDARIACWGNNDSGQADPPGGRFDAIAAGAYHSCGLRTDAPIACWGNNDSGQADPPGGRFDAIAAGAHHSCGLRSDAAIVCWGGNRWGQADAPGGAFTSVTAGLEHSCGLRTDGGVACWGHNFSGQADAPAGAFTAVSAGWFHSCGVRSDGSVACWGRLGHQPTAVGATLHTVSARPSPADCRPHRGDSILGPGFPLDWFALPAAGTLRVAVVFVDFHDAVAGYSVQREAEAGLPFAEQYLEAASHGRLNVEFVPLDRWLRLEHGYGHYTFSFVGEAARLADEHLDYGDFDVMMAVAPSSTFSGGLARGIVTTDEGSVTTVQINRHFDGSHGNSPRLWGLLAAHELMHNLGLADLYDLDGTRQHSVDVLEGKVLTWIELGLMGLSALFVGDKEDPARAYELVDADGFSSTGIWPHFTADEMLSWSRWQVGWLEPHQVACVIDDATVHLKPVAMDPGDGIGMAAVPLSDHEVLVVESRRKLGYDARSEGLYQDGDRLALPTLGPEGVLVYTVDASVDTGQLPMTVHGHAGSGVLDDHPLLGIGESVTVRGYTITVTADDGETHTVTITKNGGG